MRPQPLPGQPRYRTEKQIVEGMFELAIGTLQVIAVLILAYAAYLATRKSGGPLVPDEPGAASSRQNHRSTAASDKLGGDHGLAR
jgi:hypothetical protein